MGQRLRLELSGPSPTPKSQHCLWLCDPLRGVRVGMHLMFCSQTVGEGHFFFFLGSPLPMCAFVQSRKRHSPWVDDE